MAPRPNGEGELVLAHCVHDGGLRGRDALGEAAGVQVQDRIERQERDREERNRPGDSNSFPIS
ncbi:hypothetical protein [Bradyrhizobium liaoningense]|uniref:hypothetical protein n=1 Tax=Bradyrhizobium liaoningense TaxID=43992 RepID=UPI001BAE2BBB|nr:hypothetical protein [Bradyrhizobium liaoningense]MBR0717541.1 hypothetical protein [Bradyrhizobium liaoningense]